MERSGSPGGGGGGGGEEEEGGPGPSRAPDAAPGPSAAMARPLVPSSQKALLLELKGLQEEPVEGFRVTLVDEGDLYNWEVAIFGPPNTYYEGGYFKVRGRRPGPLPRPGAPSSRGPGLSSSPGHRPSSPGPSSSQSSRAPVPSLGPSPPIPPPMAPASDPPPLLEPPSSQATLLLLQDPLSSLALLLQLDALLPLSAPPL